MTNDIQDYLSFLRFCLSPESEVPSCVANIDWLKLYDFANMQSIAGIYAYTITGDDARLTACSWMGNKPGAKEVLKWMKKKILIQRQNEELNTHCVKTVRGFTKGGFRTCILKGQGNTLFYRDPYIRSAGDIDIWVEGGRWKVFRFVRNLFPDAPFKCQHIELPIWKDIAVEVHFYPMYLENLWANRKLQKFYRQHEAEQFAHFVTLPGTDEQIAIPTPFFNAIYQLTHINVHILIEGIGLRQFIDYYYVLKNLTDEERKEAIRLLKTMNLGHLAASVMYIENTVLGLEDQYLLTQPDEKRGRHLLHEIEICGNFGKYDTRMNHGFDPKTNQDKEGFWHVQVRKIIKNSHFITDYPSEELSEPIFRIAHFIWRQWYQVKWLTYNLLKKQS